MYRIILNNTDVVQGDGRKVISPVLKEKVGCAGFLSYSIPFDDRYYDRYRNRSTTVSVYEDGVSVPIWEGDLFTSERDFWNTKKHTFEGDMAYLNDVQFPPYDFKGDIPQFIERILNYYNSKCSPGREIYPGTITVTDPNGYISRSNQEFSSCWKVLSDKLAGICGGYFRIRRTGGAYRYLDYLTDPGLHNSQRIEFGKNLLDIEEYIDASKIATVIIPQGAMLQDEEGNNLGRVTIETAAENTSGLPYYETDFIDTYGRIEVTVVWEDVTVPDNLYRKCKEYARTMVEEAITITARVADLHLTDSQIQAFDVGDLIDLYSPPHDLTVTLMLSERNRNLNEPDRDEITLGNTQKTYTESSSANFRQIQDA